MKKFRLKKAEVDEFNANKLKAAYPGDEGERSDFIESCIMRYSLYIHVYYRGYRNLVFAMFHLSDSSRNGRKSQGYEETKYLMKRQKQTINGLIEEALLESEAKGAKGDELNRSGELFIRKNPQTKVKVVDGSSLAVAVVLNNIPKGSTQFVFKGNFDNVAGKGRYFDFGASFIPASIEYAKDVSLLCATLSRDGRSVRTVEHLLLALEGAGVDNCHVEIVSSHQNDTSAEVPIFDGLAREWVKAIEQVGLTAAMDSIGRSCDKLAPYLSQPVHVSKGDSLIAAFPSKETNISYGINFPQLPAIGLQ
nr:probable UDP-3-O-acyl-N-acetylglucosamine deacetylase 2, mitochondrial isoform X1 [Tanacetum cinerariifolium]